MTTKLHELIANVVKIPVAKVTPTLTMADTPEWDSLSHMELIVSIEEQFGINLDADEIVQMTSVGAIARLLEAKGVSPA